MFGLGWITVLGVLKKLWKPLLLITLAVSLFGVGYFKGKRNCANIVERKVFVEVEKRREEVQKEQVKTKKRQDEIRKSRDKNPANDKRDSCLLSNDPYGVDCLHP